MALTPLWLVGMFGRGLWTPDEPREADIAWRMSQQSDRTLPQLAGVPFLEKPPLSYWMSAAALNRLGDAAQAARAPNLLYAVIGALSLAALALAMQADVAAAVIATLVAMSALTALRVSVWLAPDACLLAGCALALLGAWRGYRAAPGTAKAGGYALMHLGAAIGFMAKSAPGWLVPALALRSLAGSGAGRNCAAGSCTPALRSRPSSSVHGCSPSRASRRPVRRCGRCSGTTSPGGSRRSPLR